jgi:hypothetical protein
MAIDRRVRIDIEPQLRASHSARLLFDGAEPLFQPIQSGGEPVEPMRR